MKSEPHLVKSAIKRVGPMYTADVGAALVKALGPGKRIPVLVRCHGEVYRSTVMPAGKGKGRVHMRADVFRAIGLEAGDEIEFTLERDDESREVDPPADLQRAMQFRPAAAAGWKTAPVSYRRAMLGYLDSARRPETRAAHLEIFLERLCERANRAAAKVKQESRG